MSKDVENISLGELHQLHTHGNGVVTLINRHVIKTLQDGRRFLLGRINDIEHTAQQGDAYLPNWGLGLFVPEIEAVIAAGALRIVPYQPIDGVVEVVD